MKQNQMMNLKQYQVKYIIYDLLSFLDLCKNSYNPENPELMREWINFQTFNSYKDFKGEISVLFVKFIRELFECNSEKTIKKVLSGDDGLKLINIIIEWYRVYYKNLNTLSKYITDFKQFLEKTKNIPPELTKNIHLTEDEYKQLQNNRKEIMIKKVQSDEVKQPHGFNDYIDLVQKLYKSEDNIDNLISLMLSSGLRKIEILVVSNFEKMETEGENRVRILTLAKKQVIDVKDIYTRELLGLNCDEFLRGIDKIRNYMAINVFKLQSIEELKHIDLPTIGKKIDTKLNKKFKTLGFGNITAHKSRDLYGDMIYTLKKQSNGEKHNIIEKLLDTKKIFHHKNLETSIHYIEN